MGTWPRLPGLVTLAALLLLPPQQVAAQEEDSSALFEALGAAPAEVPGGAGGALTPQAPDLGALRLKLRGEHEFSYHAPVQPAFQDYQGEIKAPAMRNLLGLEAWQGPVKLVSEWHLDLLADPARPDGEGQLGEWGTVTRLRPGENYLSWNPRDLRLAVGYQLHSWGVADKLNPTDNLNPRDYTVGLDFDKIPILSADLTWYPNEALALEGVFVPFEQPDRWPVDWAGRVPAELFAGRSVNLGSGEVSLEPGQALVRGEPIPYEASSFLAGGRLSYRSDALDLSLSYLYDFDSLFTPVITTSNDPVTITGTDLPTGKTFTRVETLTLTRQRLHRFGADAKTTVGPLGLWVEAAWSQSGRNGDQDWAERRSRLDYVLGLDFNYGPNDAWYANLQYLGTWVPGFDDDFHKTYPGGLPESSQVGNQAYMQAYYQRALVDPFGLYTEGLLQGLTARLEWELLDGDLTPQLSAAWLMPFLYDQEARSRYGSLSLNPELDWMPAASFHLKLGAQLAWAWVREPGAELRLDTSDDRVGFFTPSNSVYLMVAYKWNQDLVP